MNMILHGIEAPNILHTKGCNREARTRCRAQIFDGQDDKVIALNFRLEGGA
jgi:hypothetical protein